jgi:hypothetical protein
VQFDKRKGAYNLWAFYLHTALLRQAFTHFGKFPYITEHRCIVWERRSMGRRRRRSMSHSIKNLFVIQPGSPK